MSWEPSTKASSGEKALDENAGELKKQTGQLNEPLQSQGKGAPTQQEPPKTGVKEPSGQTPSLKESPQSHKSRAQRRKKGKQHRPRPRDKGPKLNSIGVPILRTSDKAPPNDEE
ncbi:hypothetical protein OEA41_000192 [Lepraria neglecta]|uniref:Uncharacterized protein n=1 Tax=Lepraria neglecta TaxID=209136 RepID=A0AAE0DPJ9_9LECA|nr:hypothetical protein OEA41_000192 [Lepraria neglecta]